MRYNPPPEVVVGFRSTGILLPLVFAAMLGAQEEFDTVDPLDDDFRTGIEVGEKIPPFRLADRNGKTWDFESIRGPKGALVLFYRSADW